MKKPDLLIVGGGPAGLCGAIEAGKHGLKVLLADENIKLGGQLFKQTHKFFGHEGFFASTRGFEIGEKLVKEVKKLENVEVMLETTVVGIYEDAVVVYNRRNNVTFEVQPAYILLATGASERYLVFPGNDLPGVYGAGAVQTLVNQYGVLPGRSFLIVGSGNIGLILAYQLAQAGCEVKAILEITDRIGGYTVHANKVKRLGIPILLRHTILKALGKDEVQGAVIAKVDENGKPILGTEREYVVDVICLAVGLQPSVELAGQAGAELIYIPELGGYVPKRDINMRTSVPNLFVAGDISGIEEATTAMIEGKIAALSIVEEVKNIQLTDEKQALIRELEMFRSGPTSEKVRKGLEKMGLVFSPIAFSSPQQKPGKRGKLRAIIECPQAIPCNPCETSCPAKAIKVGDNVNSIPTIDYDKCTGCGICVTKCPGLAIFLVQEDIADGIGIVGIPYEFLPLPEKGQMVIALDKEGSPVCEARVCRVMRSPSRTHVVFVEVPNHLLDSVRHIHVPMLEESGIVCRCEDVTVEDIEKAIDEGFTDFEELRRYLRVGMGPCGGRTCTLNTLAILARKTGKTIHELAPSTFRPPASPIPFESILKGDGRDERKI